MARVRSGVHRSLSALPRPVVPLVATASVGMVMIGRGQGLDPFTCLFTLLLVWGVVSVHRSGLVQRRGACGLHDEVDAATGVGNARAALASLEREMSRAGSHGSLFSVVVVDIGREAFAAVSPRRGVRVLSDLVRGIADDVRSSDRVCRVATSDRELIVVMLPDTAASGARLFTDRLVSHAQRRLGAQLGTTVVHGVRAQVMSQPNDHDEVDRLHRRLQVLVGTEELVLGDAARPRRHRAGRRVRRIRVGAGASAGPQAPTQIRAAGGPTPCPATTAGKERSDD